MTGQGREGDHPICTERQRRKIGETAPGSLYTPACPGCLDGREPAGSSTKGKAAGVAGDRKTKWGVAGEDPPLDGGVPKTRRAAEVRGKAFPRQSHIRKQPSHILHGSIWLV